MSPLKFLRRHWHDIGVGSAVIAGAYLVLGWNEIGMLQRLLILSFIVVLLHQFEEYSWPGGFPAVANAVLFSSPTPDRYPLNQNSSMAANVTFAYGFYLVPVFFPNVIWLGLSTFIVGAVLQVIGHAFIVNYRIRSLYSPGVATAVFGWLPLGAMYLYYIREHGLVNGRVWLAAIGFTVVATGFIFGVIEMVLLGDKNSAHPFDPDEMKRFDIEGKLARTRRQIAPRPEAGK